MINFYRSASIAPGKTTAAMSFAREAAAYIKGKTGLEVRIGVPIGGNPNRIGWSVQYESLAALDDTQMKLMQDQKYLDLIAKSADNFIPGSVHDDIWRIL
jgi:hypothetical protein